MEKVTSLERYHALVKTAKKEKKAVATNCFLFPYTIQHYIELGRFYYEELASGVAFYFDSETYYLGYYYLNTELSVEIQRKDKPVVTQMIYGEKAKDNAFKKMEEMFALAGFVLADTMKQITADPQVVLQKIYSPVKVAKRLLEKQGFRVSPISREYFDQVSKLQKETPEIPFYQIPYFSEKELIEDAQCGRLLGIFDSKNNLCTVRHFFPEGKNLYGWLAVKSEYKDLYGMALLMTEITMNYAIENNFKISGWITDNNKQSMQYHMKLGYQWTGRCMDEWVLMSRGGA